MYFIFKKSFKFEIAPNTVIIKDVKTLHHKANRGLFSGVYVFCGDDDVVLYVGKTRDLSARMLGHRKSHFYHLIRFILLYECVSSYDSEVLETIAINDLRPLYNRDKVYFNESEIKKRLNEIEYVIGYLKDEIEYLEQDVKYLEGDFNTVYELDGFSINSEVEPIKDEINRLFSRIKELQTEKYRLSVQLN